MYLLLNKYLYLIPLIVRVCVSKSQRCKCFGNAIFLYYSTFTNTNILNCTLKKGHF